MKFAFIAAALIGGTAGCMEHAAVIVAGSTGYYNYRH